MPRLETVSLWLMAAFYVSAGVNHFLSPEFYLPIMPPYLPWHAELVFLSGVAEVLIGIGLLIPATRVLAAWGAIALLVAVFPANIHMALHPEHFPKFRKELLWARLPVQGLFAWFTWRGTA